MASSHRSTDKRRSSQTKHRRTSKNTSTTSKDYPSVVSFGLDEDTNEKIRSLFTDLMALPPMDKTGPMSGRCGPETTQMETFLADNFGFQNIPNEYIVQGVRNFNISQPPESLPSNKLIEFPRPQKNSFQMTVEEIIRWQQSYVVYADGQVVGMNGNFLRKALEGKSENGEEAFRMKLVVRVSTCPILMEFDANIIARKLDEDWPNRIKLVSVTGIDFAGRIHDYGDMFYCVPNWKRIFHEDPATQLPFLYGNRDFIPRERTSKPDLKRKRVFHLLVRMARLRLHACDKEGVEVVVETGIGLGVFAGRQIGIDDKIRRWSARAIQTVLEEHGPTFNKIRAVVFALPIFNQDRDVFHDFVDQFRKRNYRGTIPVLIADQDMYRLTVSIARHGFTVSELNPADSHGVFGEYWQNRGPAVEEKLALTTLGLLVQHHLINPEVLKPDRYQLLEFSGTPMLDWRVTVERDEETADRMRCFYC